MRMTQEGHLTPAALHAFGEGALCQAQRLQVAQHVGVCDVCLMKLAALGAAAMPLLTPPAQLVQRALRKAARPVRLSVRQLGLAMAAACVALALWCATAVWLQRGGGVAPGTLQTLTTQLSQGVNSLSEQLAGVLTAAFEWTA